MKCPRCVQKIHRGAVECPHCGFFMSMADDLFGRYDVRLSKLSDVAGVLRYRERKEVRAILDEFEQRFPGCFFAVYFGAQEDLPCVRQFGLWLLNRGVFEDTKEKRGNGGCVLLTVDVAAKVAGFSYGYFLEAYLDEEATFSALSVAHPYLLQGDYPMAVDEMVKSITKTLKKHAKQVAKDEESYLLKVKGPQPETVEVIDEKGGAKDAKEEDEKEEQAKEEEANAEEVEGSEEKEPKKAEEAEKEVVEAFPVNQFPLNEKKESVERG